MSTEPTDWHRLPASRLRPPGPTGVSAVTIATRTAIALLAIAALWHAFVLLRPLPGPPSSGANAPAHAAGFEWHTPDLEDRQANLDALRGDNHYAQDRLPWAAELALETTDEPETIPDVIPAERPLESFVSDTGEMLVDDVDSLPEDIKQARSSLKLRGIRSSTEEGFVAMISLVHTKNPLESTDYRVGDTFTDPRHDAAEWRVAGIDARRDRVVLERSGKRVALDLYPDSVVRADPALDTISASPAMGAGRITVEGKTRAQVVAELLDAEMSTEDIRALLDMIDADSLPEIKPREIPDPEEVVRRMDEAKQNAPAPTNDMALLIQMMSSGQNPVEFMEQREAEPHSAEPEDE